ncbi:MAG: protein DA1 [Prevotella sp.]|nr:protein DA1 [Prevotella sp.]
MKCAYCGEELRGMFKKDLHGFGAHPEHAFQCFSCQRFVASTDHRLPDGRYQCADCMQKEVKTDKHVEWVETRVKQMLAAHGIDKWPSSVPIRLIQPRYTPGRPATQAHKMGETKVAKSIFSKSYEVNMLNHMHRIVFGGVLAHELLHVWQYERNIYLRSELTEGFCNLGSWIVYKHMATPVSQAMMTILERDPTPVYGDGFRIVKAVYDNLANGSLPDVMSQLKKM